MAPRCVCSPWEWGREATYAWYAAIPSRLHPDNCLLDADATAPYGADKNSAIIPARAMRCCGTMPN